MRHGLREEVTSDARSWPTATSQPIPPILKAALKNFHQDGYHGTTVRRVAQDVGLTMPSLYYHYGSKEGLLFALLDLAMDDLQAQVDLCLEAAGDNTLTRFQGFIAAIALHYTRRRELATLHDEFRFLEEDFRAKYVARRVVIQQTLEQLIQSGIAEDVFDETDARFTTLVLLGMLRGILDWYTESGPLSAMEIANRYTGYAMRLVVSPREIESAV